MLIITPQYQELKNNYEKLLMRQLQHDQVLKEKDEQLALALGQAAAFKQIAEQLTTLVTDLQAQVAALTTINEQQKKQLGKLALLEHQYEQLRKMVYGTSSEKSTGNGNNSSQISLAIDAEVVDACSIHDGQRIAEHTKQKAKKNENHPGRNEIPEHIEHKYIDMHPEGLPEGAELYDTIETKQLEYDPARLFATVYRRYKYKLQKEDGTFEFFIAALPADKDKSIAAPSLKAHVAVEKYLYHMPINRQALRFAQSGIILPQTTIGNWIAKTAFDITGIYDALRNKVIRPAMGYLMADESPFQVLDQEKVKGKKAHLGYMWAYCNPVDKLVFFEYQRGRSNKHAHEVLNDYQGYLQSDAYKVYEHYAKRQGITAVNCNAHSRRKFSDAKLTDKRRAEHALALYGKLYAIESYCKEMNLSFDERKQLRQEKSVPIFEELARWIREETPKLPPLKTPIRKAFNYFSEREKQLGMFLHDGMLEIDTNIIENKIRPIALGRNNYMFAGSHDAAQNAAIIYSLFATCKLHDVNAYDWLKYVLTVIPTFPASRIEELLPQNWKKSISE